MRAEVVVGTGGKFRDWRLQMATDSFPTTDTGLAAYLKYKGITLLSVEFANGQGTFVFGSPPRGLVDSFTSGLAPEAQYLQVYKSLLRMVKSSNDK